MVVWGLTGLQEPMIPVYEPNYDVRVTVASLKAALAVDESTPSILARVVASLPSLSLVARWLKDMPPPVT